MFDQSKIIVKKIAEEFLNIQLRFVFGGRKRFGSSDFPEIRLSLYKREWYNSTDSTLRRSGRQLKAGFQTGLLYWLIEVRVCCIHMCVPLTVRVLRRLAAILVPHTQQ